MVKLSLKQILWQRGKEKHRNLWGKSVTTSWFRLDEHLKLHFYLIMSDKRKEKRDKHIIKASLFQNIWDCNLPLFPGQTDVYLCWLLAKRDYEGLKRQRWSLARFIFLLSFSDNVCGRHQMCSSLQANFGLKCRSTLTFTESLPKLLLVDIVFEHDTIYRCRKASIFLTAIRGLNSIWLMLKESLMYYITDRVLMHNCQASRKCIKTMLFHHILRNHIFFVYGSRIGTVLFCFLSFLRGVNFIVDQNICCYLLHSRISLSVI